MYYKLSLLLILLCLSCGTKKTVLLERFLPQGDKSVISLQEDNKVIFIFISNYQSYAEKLLHHEGDEYNLFYRMLNSKGDDSVPVHVYGIERDRIITIVVDDNPVDYSLGSYLKYENNKVKKMSPEEIRHWTEICHENIIGE
ncbi:MAG: hypothetical protein KAS70_02815 [Planctomycetes bacterium]|nr:hypothetical protein [Planctomycetota bacterium]